VNFPTLRRNAAETRQETEIQFPTFGAAALGLHVYLEICRVCCGLFHGTTVANPNPVEF
jgi:hypothetical protein